MKLPSPAPEYVTVVARIERLSRDLGRLASEFALLRERAARLEATLAEIERTPSVDRQQLEPVEQLEPAASVVVSVPSAPTGPLDTPPAPQTVVAIPTPTLPPAARRSAPIAAIEPISANPPVPKPDASNRIPISQRVVDTVDRRWAPVAAALAQGRSRAVDALDRQWRELREFVVRHHRVGFIAAPLLAVLILSTWMTSAGSDPSDEPDVNRDGTATALARGAAPAATPRPTTPTTAGGVLVASPMTTRTATGVASPTSARITTATAQASTTAAATATTDGGLPASETATPVPPEATATVTATLEPTATSVPTAISADVVPGGVGSTETMVVETYGLAEAEQDGRSVYSDGSVLVTYAGGRAVRITFLLDIDDLELSVDDAEALVSYYRPLDAQLEGEGPGDAGTIIRVYSSPLLVALFDGVDVGGRRVDRYVEVIRFDPASQRATSVEMALGEQP